LAERLGGVTWRSDLAEWLGGAAWRYDLAVWSPAMGDGSSKPGSVSRDSVVIVSVGRAG
jgi:hypothetical protein